MGSLLLLSCDRREIALEFELPTEEPKIVLGAILVNGGYASVLVERTLPINGGGHTNASINNAEILLWENDEILTTLQFKSDTVWSQAPDVDVIQLIITQIKSRYRSSEKLDLSVGASYHITATASGFPDAISENVIFKNETTLVDYEASDSEINELVGGLIFSEINLSLRNTSYELQEIIIEYYPWRNNIDELELIPSPPTPDVAFSYNLNGLIEDSLLITHQDIQIRAFFATNEQGCFNGCLFTPKGTMILITTIGQELREYRKYSSSSEYLGGFFPPNPYLKTNINGGYGFFAIIEQDTLIIEE